MTTTPDSRIRDDWTLPAETAAPTPSPIDTSTTAGKIAVMEAYERGEPCEWRPKQVTEPQVDWQHVGQKPQWNWCNTDYRIAPPPVARTALQRARERTRAVLVDEATTGDVQLAMLVREIDVAPAVWFGSTLLDKCGIVGHAPGRYRLVRDDA